MYGAFRFEDIYAEVTILTSQFRPPENSQFLGPG